MFPVVERYQVYLVHDFSSKKQKWDLFNFAINSVLTGEPFNLKLVFGSVL